MLTPNAYRVSWNTSDVINEAIHRRTLANIARFAKAGPKEIERRLQVLDEEWDIERYLETMAPTFSLLGLGLGLAVSRKWLLVPFVVQSFFLQHALQGWCPPVPFLRRMGVRTMVEIDVERNALKAIRGDFKDIPTEGDEDAIATKVLEAAERNGHHRYPRRA